LNERDYIEQMINKLLLMVFKAYTKVTSMSGQAEMMMMLLRDLMNQA